MPTAPLPGVPTCMQVSPRLVGLALGHVLNLTGTMQWAVRQTAEAENNMTRRVLEGKPRLQRRDFAAQQPG